MVESFASALHLGSNLHPDEGIGLEGVEMLTPAIASLSLLKALDLSFNNIENEGALLLGQVFSLKILYVFTPPL